MLRAPFAGHSIGLGRFATCEQAELARCVVCVTSVARAQRDSLTHHIKYLTKGAHILT